MKKNLITLCLLILSSTCFAQTVYKVNLNNQWGRTATFVEYSWGGENVQFATNLKTGLPNNASYVPFATATNATLSMTFGKDTGAPVTNTECQVNFNADGSLKNVINPSDRRNGIVCSLTQISNTEWTLTLLPPANAEAEQIN